MNRQVICLVGRRRNACAGTWLGGGVGEEKGRRCCRRTSDKDSGYLSAPGGGVDLLGKRRGHVQFVYGP